MSTAERLSPFLQCDGLSSSDWEVEAPGDGPSYVVLIADPAGIIRAEAPHEAEAWKTAMIELHRRTASRRPGVGRTDAGSVPQARQAVATSAGR